MTKCPCCAIELSKTTLEPGLPSFECSRCHGFWLQADPLLDWIARQPDTTPEGAERSSPTPAFDSKKALLCPDCGLILRRFKVTSELKFYVDRCGTCNGIWLDDGEWQAIKAHGLARQLHLFFTDAWQRQLRQDSMRAQLEKMHRERFGDRDYAELQRIRQWLKSHPHRTSLLAYLAEEDPDKP